MIASSWGWTPSAGVDKVTNTCHSPPKGKPLGSPMAMDVQMDVTWL